MATPATLTYEQLHRQILSGKTAPVYLLHGEEGYFTDLLINDFVGLISPDDRDFNLYTLYAPETSMIAVDETCRRFPMMADRMVVILKEAQAISATELNKLHTYCENPSPSTVLVISCRGEQAKGKDLIAAIRKNGVIFESKKLKESAVAGVLQTLIKEKGLGVEPKSLAMLTEYVGTDMSRLHNEVDKLAVALGRGATITPESIERNIGFSKDFNNFELINALAAHNGAKAYRIIEFFRANPKSNPFVMTISAIFNFFSDLMIFHFSRDKSPAALVAAMGLRSEWQLKNYTGAARNYNAYKVIEIIGAIREADTRSKGIGSRIDPYDALHDLVFRILNAQGILPV